MKLGFQSVKDMRLRHVRIIIPQVYLGPKLLPHGLKIELNNASGPMLAQIDRKNNWTRSWSRRFLPSLDQLIRSRQHIRQDLHTDG